jgi:hypothetical protein
MTVKVSSIDRLAGFALVLATLACSNPPESLVGQTDPGAAAAAAATITPDDLRVRIGVLAHDSMAGRDTPSAELEQTARYIAARFAEFGLLPAEGNSYLQEYPLVISGPGPADQQSLSIEGPGAAPIPASAIVTVPAGRDLRGSGRLVVTTASDTGDLRGRIAVLVASQATAQQALGGIRTVLDRGAAGLIIAVDGPASYFDGLRRFFGRTSLSVGVPDLLPAPTMLVGMDGLPGAVREALASGRSLEAYSASLRTTGSIREAQGFNTIGWIEGSDPELRDEYLVFSAHMDHVGVGRPVAGDSIYNGADDDASGTAAIVELAEAFASFETPPRRSLVFLTVSGEEKGLLGSEWYAGHPSFPLESTVANLNIDMIGRNWEDTVVAIGRGESTLGHTLESVVAAHRELGLTMIDDPWPDERFYFRSDHYNFARNGVPILFFFTGTHEDYHRPSDEPDRILYDKTARITRLVFHLGLEIADSDSRPEWDPGAYRRVVEGGGR